MDSINYYAGEIRRLETRILELKKKILEVRLLDCHFTIIPLIPQGLCYIISFQLTPSQLCLTSIVSGLQGSSGH